MASDSFDLRFGEKNSARSYSASENLRGFFLVEIGKNIGEGAIENAIRKTDTVGFGNFQNHAGNRFLCGGRKIHLRNPPVGVGKYGIPATSL